MKDIPLKVNIIYYPEGDYSLIYPYDNKKDSTARRRRVILSIKSHSSIKGDPQEIVIKNTGFRISFFESIPGKTPRWLQNDSRDFFCIPMLVSHPELNSIGRKFIIYVDLKGLLQNLPTLDVTNGEVSGYFCLEETPYLSGISGVSLLLEDSDIKESLEFNSFFESSSNTTKWKPGYTYILPNKNIILYLGHLSEISKWDRPSIRSIYPKSSGHPVIYSTKYIGITGYTEGHLYIDYNNLPDELISQINFNTGNKTSDFLGRWIKTISSEYPKIAYSLLGKYYGGKLKRAVEYKKILEDDLGENLSECLGNLLSQYINDLGLNYEYVTDCNFSVFTETKKSKFIKDMTFKLSKNIENYIYNLHASTVKPKTVDELIPEIKKRLTGGSMYYNPFWYFIYLSKAIGEEKIKDLLKTNLLRWLS